MNFSTQLRHAIQASGMSWYRIAKDLEISQSSISRFMNGKGGLSQKVIDRLWNMLDLRIDHNKEQSNGN